MKKVHGFFALVVCCVMMLTLWAAPSSAVKVTDDGVNYFVFGDSNGDGTVDIRDLVRMKKNVADSSVEICLCAGDINADDELDAGDVSCFVRCLLGVDSNVTTGGDLWSEIY